MTPDKGLLIVKGKGFSEGWIEFLDKRIGRQVAEMLNAQIVGGKKGSRWRDDIWTMKYLPRFKWSDLSEQVGALSTIISCSRSVADIVYLIAHEAAVRRARLRNELKQSALEQKDYLKKSEAAKVIRRKETKSVKPQKDNDAAKPSFKQRSAKKQHSEDLSSMRDVLAGVFG